MNQIQHIDRITNHMDKEIKHDFWRDYWMNESRTFGQVYKLIIVKNKKYGLWDMMMHSLVTRKQHSLYPAEGSSKFLCTVGTHLINYWHYIPEDYNPDTNHHENLKLTCQRSLCWWKGNDSKGSSCGLFQLNNQTFTKKTERIQGTLTGKLVLSKLAQSNRNMGQNLSTGRNMILLKDLSSHPNYHRLKMYSVLGYDVVSTVKFLPMFRKIVLPPSSG